MAIQPIDLQALFSQMDKVGKTQTAQKEGVEIQQGILNAMSQKKNDEKIRSVNQAREPEEGAERIRERKPRNQGDQGSREERDTAEDEAPADERETVSDPNLGRNVDLSG